MDTQTTMAMYGCPLGDQHKADMADHTGTCKSQAVGTIRYFQRSRGDMKIRKNIQVVDGADNCEYPIYSASLKDFMQIFPDEGQDIEFAEDFFARVGRRRAGAISMRLWPARVDKKTINGIHGTLFYQLGFKKKYYPTKRESEMVTGFEPKPKCESDTGVDAMT